MHIDYTARATRTAAIIRVNAAAVVGTVSNIIILYKQQSALYYIKTQ